jgi:hypothetical protein
MPFLPHKHLGRHRCYPESYHSSNFGFDTLTRHPRPLRTLCRRAVPSSMRGVRGVKDTGSVNLSGLSCAKVGVILRQTSFLLVPSSDFSMGSSLFTAVRTALATEEQYIPYLDERCQRCQRRRQCQFVGVILRQGRGYPAPNFFPPSTQLGFSMGSSLFTAVRTTLATARRHIPIVGSPSRGDSIIILTTIAVAIFCFDILTQPPSAIGLPL